MFGAMGISKLMYRSGLYLHEFFLVVTLGTLLHTLQFAPLRPL